MFLAEDCPAKVASRNPLKASNLPPGFEPTQYAARRNNISLLPRIKWKLPPKIILDDALLVASGGESTETRTENLRIAKVLEAFYPHRSLIPTRPSVSPAVEEAHFDDDKTPNIPLTFIEDQCEPPAAVSGLGPELSLAACAALSALTKEQGCQIDADLLFKLLSDPKIVTKLMNDMKAKPLETANNTVIITEPRLAPQHVTSTAMDRNPPPVPGNGVLHNVPVSVQSSATDPPLPKATQPMSGALSMNLNHQISTSVAHTYPLSSELKPLPRLEDSYTADPSKQSPVDDVVVSEQKPQSLNISTLSTWNMNRVSESARTETDSQICNGNKNPDDQVSAKPVKNLDYFKNLIREHGGVKPATNETNNYKGRVDAMKVVKVKNQKPCMFFNRPKGCRLGESCLYLHDRSKRLCTDAAPHFPRAKRLKFGS